MDSKNNPVLKKYAAKRRLNKPVATRTGQNLDNAYESKLSQEHDTADIDYDPTRAPESKKKCTPSKLANIKQSQYKHASTERPIQCFIQHEREAAEDDVSRMHFETRIEPNLNNDCANKLGIQQADTADIDYDPRRTTALTNIKCTPSNLPNEVHSQSKNERPCKPVQLFPSERQSEVDYERLPNFFSPSSSVSYQQYGKQRPVQILQPEKNSHDLVHLNLTSPSTSLSHQQYALTTDENQRSKMQTVDIAMIDYDSTQKTLLNKRKRTPSKLDAEKRNQPTNISLNTQPAFVEKSLFPVKQTVNLSLEHDPNQQLAQQVPKRTNSKLQAKPVTSPSRPLQILQSKKNSHDKVHLNLTSPSTSLSHQQYTPTTDENRRSKMHTADIAMIDYDSTKKTLPNKRKRTPSILDAEVRNEPTKTRIHLELASNSAQVINFFPISTSPSFSVSQQQVFAAEVHESLNTQPAFVEKSLIPVNQAVNLSLEYDPNQPLAKKVRKRTNSKLQTRPVTRGNTNAASETIGKKRIKSNFVDSSIYYTDEELHEMEKMGLPEPLSPEQLDDVINRFRETYHEPILVCAVCDQLCPISTTEIIKPSQLPAGFFTELVAPSPGTIGSNKAPPLHPLLLKQYSTSCFFPEDVRFLNLLLSPRGIARHENGCTDHLAKITCNCEPMVVICKQLRFGCLPSLKRSTIPKFAIANGNWIGQLTRSLQDMTYISRCLIRPIQSCGQIGLFSGRYRSGCGWSLKGHMYSTRLDVPIVRRSLPLAPSEAPVRIIFVAPNTKEGYVQERAKVARAKKEYIVQPDKIAKTLEWFRQVDHPAVRGIEHDGDCLQSLPWNEVAESIFIMNDTEDVEENAEVFVEDNTGGPDLGKSNEDFDDAIPVSHSVTLGKNTDENSHTLASKALNTEAPDKIPSKVFAVHSSNEFVRDSDPDYFETRFPELFPFGRGGFGEVRRKPISRAALLKYTLNLSTRHHQRPDYVLACYDMINRMDVFNRCYVRTKLPSRCFTKAGKYMMKGEAYGRVLSREAIEQAGQYKLRCAQNASKGIRLPKPPPNLDGLGMSFFTDISIATQTVQHSQAAMNNNRQNVYAAHNALGKAQIWFTFSPDDTKCYKICWYALGEGSEPYNMKAPTGSFRFDMISENPVAAALYFERVLELVIEHIIGWSLHANRPYKRGGLFGVPKAWLRVVEEQGRLTLHAHFLIWLYGHEVLHDQFHNAAIIQDIIKEKVKIVQSNLMSEAIRQDVVEGLTNSTCKDKPSSFREKNENFVCEPASGGVTNTTTAENKDENDEKTNHLQRLKPATPPGPLDNLLNSLEKLIDACVCGELILPTIEMKIVTSCPLLECQGVLHNISGEAFEKLQHQTRNKHQTEPHSLVCSKCNTTYTASSRIEAALEHGFHRCAGRNKLSQTELDDLIWSGLPPKPEDKGSLEYDLWLLKLASIQASVNIHDWRHRVSCFKKGGDCCRYKLPKKQTTETKICPIFEKVSDNGDQSETSNTSKVLQLIFTIRKRAPFIYLTDCSILLLSVLHCNNCIRYVENQRVSLYYGVYTSKYSGELEKSIAGILRAMSMYLARMEKRKRNEGGAESAEGASSNCNSTTNVNRSLQKNPNEKSNNADPDNPNLQSVRSDSSIGLGRLLTAARASTNGDTIGAPLAAFAARGNKIFEMSHETALLPVAQAVAFLKKEPLTASVNKHGNVYATILDYVYRNSEEQSICDMNYWDFIRLHTTRKYPQKKKNSKSKEKERFEEEFQRDYDGEDVEDNEEEWDTLNKSGNPLFAFQSNHPSYKTHGHCERPRAVWTRYLGKRLPDIKDFEKNNNDLSSEEIELRKEQYAQGILVMFYPFRELEDLYDSAGTWWSSFKKREPELLANAKVSNIIGNIQNFYESFCRSGSDELLPPMKSTYDFEQSVEDEKTVDNDDNNSKDDPNLICIETDNLEENEHWQKTDPFVATLAAQDNLTSKLVPLTQTNEVSVIDAEKAVEAIKKKNNGEKFMLPGRAMLNTNENESANDEIDWAILDKPVLTRVQLVENIALALRSREPGPHHSESQEPEGLEQNFPTISSHSQVWNLNEKQHMAFLLMSSALLQFLYTSNTSHLSHKTMPSETEILVYLKDILQSRNQIGLYLGGSGGTGKSRVIHAMVDFARRWHSAASIVVTASSGIAAMLIGGCTLHAALGVSVSLDPPEPKEHHVQAWSEIGLIIVDEFSMITPAMFDLLERRLRALKCRLDTPFGGVHIVLCGDFYQLPPVASVPIYRIPSEADNKKDSRALASSRGRDWWRSILTDVIELTQNHRQGDTRWAESLGRWRINQPTQQDIDDVNNRYCDPNSGTSNPLHLAPADTIIAVPTNKAREDGLRYHERKLLADLQEIPDGNLDWQTRGVLLVQASLTRGEGSQRVQQKHFEYVRGLSSDRLGAVGNLFCVIGAPYIVGHNADVSKGIANGTLSRLQHVILNESTTIRIVEFENGAKVHAVFASDVKCLLFKHTLSGWITAELFPSLQPGCFPVVTTGNNINVKLGNKGRFKIHVSQFPCALAFILTGHKMQGQTVKSIVLGAISHRYKYGEGGWLYVILSRVKSIEGLFLLTKVPNDPKKYKPRTDIIAEMQRLSRIEEKTIKRLQQQVTCNNFTQFYRQSSL